MIEGCKHGRHAHIIGYGARQDLCMRCGAQFFTEGGWRGVDCWVKDTTKGPHKIPGCKHGPTYEIPQPCAECERERERNIALEQQLRERIEQLPRYIPDPVWGVDEDKDGTWIERADVLAILNSLGGEK